MAERFYITTAIAYPNGRPHIGHAYEAIATDVIARFQRMMGRDVYFLTGTDEHGLKMAQTARDRGMETKALADEMSGYFREMDEKLDISFDRFIRTTEADHHAASQAIWQAMEANGDLYLGRYEGWYSVRDEAFYDEKELIEGEGGAKLSPQGTPVEWTIEETWFFRLSKYQQPLLDHYAAHPDFIRPERSRNEVVRFVEGGLSDLSVSRTSFDWGVKVPGSDGHVMYVWVDALTNYLTGAGYPDANYTDRWPADLHVIGKDIARFHAVYWPAFLMSAKIALPQSVFAHGFVLHRGEKMSKSTGNVVDPIDLADRFGVDALRFFLMDAVTFGADGSYSDFAIVESNNAHLASNYGNLIQRVIAFVARKMNGVAPQLGFDQQIDQELYTTVAKAHAHWHAAMGNLEISRATGACVTASAACNKYVDTTAPWKEIKVNHERAEHCLATLICSLIRISLMMAPFTPDLSDRALATLQVPESLRTRFDWDVWTWYAENYEGFRFENPEPLVPVFELA